MLTREENDLLTRTAPGTPMGDLFRRYWLPAVRSNELVADGEPVKVQLLGEELVAFRDTQGRVGLLGEHCPHRGTSLWYARNEDCGLRCIYHGWKFDVNGACVDMPTEAPESNFMHKVHHTSYPVYEDGGVVWTYMGAPDRTPVKPGFHWTKLPETHRFLVRVWQECNYLQGIEGAIDSAHVGHLHRAFGDPDPSWGIRGKHAAQYGPSPRLDVEYTTYGFRYGAVRTLDDSTQYVRVTPFVLPCYSIVPTRPGHDILFHVWVPRDDTSNWAWDIHYNPDRPINQAEHVEVRGLWLDEQLRKVCNSQNKHLQDRDAMKTVSFSGIRGIMNQDQAVQESMGPIYDRSKEHLGTADKAVIAMRRLLLRAVRSLGEGVDPPGLDPSIPFDQICSTAVITPHIPWQEAFPQDARLTRADVEID